VSIGRQGLCGDNAQAARERPWRLGMGELPLPFVFGVRRSEVRKGIRAGREAASPPVAIQAACLKANVQLRGHESECPKGAWWLVVGHLPQPGHKACRSAFAHLFTSTVRCRCWMSSCRHPPPPSQHSTISGAAASAEGPVYRRSSRTGSPAIGPTSEVRRDPGVKRGSSR
jgi:hypothetical protein